jgi:hypothetical protein
MDSNIENIIPITNKSKSNIIISAFRFFGKDDDYSFLFKKNKDLSQDEYNKKYSFYAYSDFPHTQKECDGICNHD